MTKRILILTMLLLSNSGRMELIWSAWRSGNPGFEEDSKVGLLVQKIAVDQLITVFTQNLRQAFTLMPFLTRMLIRTFTLNGIFTHVLVRTVLQICLLAKIKPNTRNPNTIRQASLGNAIATWVNVLNDIMQILASPPASRCDSGYNMAQTYCRSTSHDWSASHLSNMF